MWKEAWTCLLLTSSEKTSGVIVFSELAKLGARSSWNFVVLVVSSSVQLSGQRCCLPFEQKETQGAYAESRRALSAMQGETRLFYNTGSIIFVQPSLIVHKRVRFSESHSRMIVTCPTRH